MLSMCTRAYKAVKYCTSDFWAAACSDHEIEPYPCFFNVLLICDGKVLNIRDEHIQNFFVDTVFPVPQCLVSVY